jgi:glycosyltransferase involved in cell wall biosynthesis
MREGVEITINPPVTVLIEYLGECLASIEKQDYSNLDVLVVLNGPASKEVEQLQVNFSSMKRPIVFLSTPLSGIVNALNFGLQNCQHELIARIDADDLMPPSRISIQVSEFQSDSELVCVGGQLEYFTSNSYPPHPGYPQCHEEICHALHRYSALPHPGVMYKKSALVRIGNYRADFPYIEDWNLWVRLSAIGKIVNLPVTTVLYRVHVNQITATNSSTQHRSIAAFSYSRLQDCLENPRKINLFKDDPNAIRFLRELIFFLFSRIRPTYMSGVFGRKELRRRLAGCIYTELKYTIGTKHKQTFKKFLLSLAIILVDPRILFVSIKNLIIKIR